MTSHANGRIPLDQLVHLGGDHYLPPGTAARWKWLQQAAWEKYGIWLVITPGWNAYRPLNIQIVYKAKYGVMAAEAGKSSHGGTYGGQIVFAIDVQNWGALSWARFAALCRLAGFTVDFVKPKELWHIGDFNNGWTVPAGAAEAPQINHETTRRPRRRSMITAAYRNDDGSIAIQRDPDGPLRWVSDPTEWSGIMAANPGTYAAQVSNAWLAAYMVKCGGVPRFTPPASALPSVVTVINADDQYIETAGGLAGIDQETANALVARGAVSYAVSQGVAKSLLAKPLQKS
ncbi:hypothetical protein [Microbacterium maritypicum]|uniref:hypothetical protein n=1 Tax=Microbacterium maritypicum TaxID=33918 RepID=UPI003A902F8B